MHPDTALIERPCAALAARDAAGMQACHHPAIVFSDPAFGGRRGAGAGATWVLGPGLRIQ